MHLIKTSMYIVVAVSLCAYRLIVFCFSITRIITNLGHAKALHIHGTCKTCKTLIKAKSWYPLVQWSPKKHLDAVQTATTGRRESITSVKWGFSLCVIMVMAVYIHVHRYKLMFLFNVSGDFSGILLIGNKREIR